MSDTNLTEAQAQAHWSKTKSLMMVTLAVWLFFGFIIHAFASTLNGIVIFGFPMGFYMAAQGSLIVFVVLLFWFANKQSQIDDEFGMAEDE